MAKRQTAVSRRIDEIHGRPCPPLGSDWVYECRKMREENELLRDCLQVMIDNTDVKSRNLITTAIEFNPEQQKPRIAESDSSKLFPSYSKESHEAGAYSRFSLSAHGCSANSSGFLRSQVNNSAIETSLLALSNYTATQNKTDDEESLPMGCECDYFGEDNSCDITTLEGGCSTLTSGGYHLCDGVAPPGKEDTSCEVSTRDEYESCDIHTSNKNVCCDLYLPNKESDAFQQHTDMKCYNCPIQIVKCVCSNSHKNVKQADGNDLPTRVKHVQCSEVHKHREKAVLLTSANTNHMSPQAQHELPRKVHGGAVSNQKAASNSVFKSKIPKLDIMSNLRQITRISSESDYLSKPYVILGEIAFELERRILDYVFTPGENTPRKSPRRHFYGFMVSNITSMIPKECTGPDGKFDQDREIRIRRRLDAVMLTLGRLGYRIEKHGSLSEELINKYGVFTSVPHERQIKELGLDDGDTLRQMVSVVACDDEERGNMLVLLECLLLLSQKDGRPILFAM